MKHSASARMHIRILSAVLALILLSGMFPARAAASEEGSGESVLYNGSFDLSNVSTQTVPGWGLNKSNANHKVTVQRDVAYGDSGIALKIEATGQSYIFSADFSVEAGATYMLSYYIRVDSAVGLRYAPFLNDGNYRGGWWLDFAATPVQDVTDGWIKVSGMVSVPESVGANANNPNSMVQLGFKVYGGSGTLYLDEVSVVKMDMNLNDPNQSFESVTPQSGAPANWQTSASDMDIAVDSTVYHDGGHSMYVNKTSLAEKSSIESAVYLPVAADNVYEFSFWMTARNASPTATIRMQLQPYAEDGSAIKLEDGSKATVYGTVSALNAGAERSPWEKVVTRASVPEGTAYVSLGFTLTRGNAEVWVDDIFFNVVEDGIDCVVYYEDFHAVDESGNISSWKHQGSGSFASENGGKLNLTAGEGYIYDELNCLMTDYTYCIRGNYTANMGGIAQVRFYDYQRQEYTQQRQTVPLQAGGTGFELNFTAPSHTYAALYIGSDQSGTVTLENITVYMTAEPPQPNRNYLDADWSARADRENVVSSVEIYNGIPTLMIDGQPTASYFYQRPDLNAYLQTDAESRIAQSGLELYVTYGGNLYKGGCAPIWLEDGTIDYAAFDAVIYDTLAASEDALVMVNFGMFAPDWWLAQNPDHRAQAHNGSSYIPLKDVSLASEKFRQEAGEVLRQLIMHMKEQNYYNRVFGIKIGGGQSYEWMCIGTGSDQGPDYSAVSKAGFRIYLQKKYGTVEALRAAWGNNTVTFETAVAPGWEERCSSSNVYMGDADTGSLSRNMVDWNLWLNEASADSFLYYCQIAKEETDNKIIVGGYNGYLWTSNTYDSQGMAHTAMDRVLDSPYVDWIASPIAYNERLLGQSSTYMTLLDTVQAHGKLYIAEQDNRTCLSDTYAGNSWDAQWDYRIGQTRTMSDTLYQQKRDFANALVNGGGLWQYDMYGGWLDDEQIYDYIRHAKAEYDISVHLDRKATNEVAVFVGDETYAYLTAENSNMSFTLLEPMLQQQRKHLAAMGAGYDTYAMSSLLEGKVLPHKLNIVLSPFEITGQMHDAIDAHLKTNGQIVVWVYLPGISDGTKLSLDNIKRATGFSIAAVEQKSTLQIQLANSGHCLTEGIAGLRYGNSVENSVSPLTYIQDTANATVLGYHTDGGQPGLAVKDMGAWTSVYSAAPCLDVQLLRNLMKMAGCHSYSQNNADVIYSSNCYVALHSASAGEKTIKLPGNFSVYDVFEEKFISMNTDVITYNHQADDTHIFRLMQPNSYAVTASIQSGKGKLSAPGLTEVRAGDDYSLRITPEIGYELKTVTVNGKTHNPDSSGILNLDSIQENTVIDVSFRKQTLLDNGGLEMGSFGANVTAEGTANVVSDDIVHSGLHSLRLNHDGVARDLVQMEVCVNPSSADRQITVSFWARLKNEATTRCINTAGYSFKPGYVLAKTAYGAQYPQRDGLWRQYTETFTLPAGATIFQYLLYIDTPGTDVYVDDLSIICDGQQLLTNGGFERGNLTGNCNMTEYTPEVVRTQLVHSGSYAAVVEYGGSVLASATELQLQKEARVQASFWTRVPENAATNGINYSLILKGQDAVLQEKTENLSLTADGMWHRQTVTFTAPAGTDAVQLQISAQEPGTVCYLDDICLTVLPLETVTVDFKDIFDDGTWRFVSEQLGLLKEKYYKIPVVLDGKDGYVIADNSDDMLQIYLNFFSVYGGSVPTTSLLIPEGAVIRPVSPMKEWAEIPGAESMQIGNKVEVCLTEARVKEWNLSLGGDLTVNFYMEIPRSIVNDAKVVVTVGGKSKTFAISDGQYDAASQTYGFSTHVAAAQMCDDICVQTLYEGAILSEQRYSVRQYALYVLNDASMSSYHGLIKKMLNYGAAAQTYFGYQTELLANSGITDVDETEIPESATEEMAVIGSAKGLAFRGASLVFRDKIAVRFYFTSGSGYTFSVNDKVYTAKTVNGMQCVEIADILPQHLDEQIVLTVTAPDGSEMKVYYGPMNYLERMKDREDNSLKQLLQALYNYHLKAKEICGKYN